MHSILSHHHSLKHVIPPFLKGIQTLTTSTWIFFVVQQFECIFKMFSKWPINLFFHQFWSQNSSRQKFFVEMMGPIRGLDWPASSGSTCGWSYRSLVEMVILRWKGSLNHFVWGCFGKGSPHPPENGGKKNHLSGGFSTWIIVQLTVPFCIVFVGSLLQWDSQNSTLKKKNEPTMQKAPFNVKDPYFGSFLN